MEQDELIEQLKKAKQKLTQAVEKEKNQEARKLNKQHADQ